MKQTNKTTQQTGKKEKRYNDTSARVATTCRDNNPSFQPLGLGFPPGTSEDASPCEGEKVKESPLQVDWTRSASSTPAAAPHWHERGAALRNSTRTAATLALKLRRLTLSVVAVGESRGDQWALQGATTQHRAQWSRSNTDSSVPQRRLGLHSASGGTNEHIGGGVPCKCCHLVVSQHRRLRGI